MLFLTAVALRSGVASHVVASSGSQDEEARKRLRAKLIKYEAAYEKYEAELTDKQKNICQAQLDVTRARLDGRDEKQVLGLYKQLQDLIIDEAERTRNNPVRVWRGNSSLWRVFNIEKPILGTCFYIARLCRDSERMTLQEKIVEIKAQANICNDYRIRQMAIELLTKNGQYEDAIDYCKEQISNIEQGKKKGRTSVYRYELIKTLLFYQKSLYGQAMQDQGIDSDQVINIGPHLVEIDLAQWRMAKKEAEEYIRENPKYAQRCLSLFSSNNSCLGPIAELKEVQEFYESTLSKISEDSAQAEVPWEKPPKDFVELTSEAKADILCSIAEACYLTLSKVPEIGLRNSHDSITKIISMREWLEKTNDVVANMLAIRLQYVIDSCILNEMYRKEKQQQGHPLEMEFRRGSFDSNLLMVLLTQNKIDEERYIDFALGFDTDIAKYCRQHHYAAKDFLSGNIIIEAPKRALEVSFWETRNVNGKEETLTHIVDIREIESGAFVLFAKAIDSKEEAAEALLPVILTSIDDARDIRLLAGIYMRYDGFVEKNELQRIIVYSKSFKNRIKTELLRERQGRIIKRRKKTVDLIVLGVSGMMANRVAVEFESIENYYELSCRMRLLPFMRNMELFPENSRKISKTWGLGIWLNLYNSE